MLLLAVAAIIPALVRATSAAKFGRMKAYPKPITMCILCTFKANQVAQWVPWPLSSSGFPFSPPGQCLSWNHIISIWKALGVLGWLSPQHRHAIQKRMGAFTWLEWRADYLPSICRWLGSKGPMNSPWDFTCCFPCLQSHSHGHHQWSHYHHHLCRCLGSHLDSSIVNPLDLGDSFESLCQWLQPPSLGCPSPSGLAATKHLRIQRAPNPRVCATQHRWVCCWGKLADPSPQIPASLVQTTVKN